MTTSGYTVGKGRLILKNKPIEVLTPLGACFLFGRSGEAVRRAVRKGHVETPFSLKFSAKEIRMIDLQSAIAYWAEAPWPFRPPLDVQINEMRHNGITVRFDGMEYDILHLWPLAYTGSQVGISPEADL